MTITIFILCKLQNAIMNSNVVYNLYSSMLFFFIKKAMFLDPLVSSYVVCQNTLVIIRRKNLQ